MNKLKRGVYFLREEGLKRTLGRVFQSLANRTLQSGEVSSLMVSFDQVLKADWTIRPSRFDTPPSEGPYVIAWIMSPPGEGSGGHQNLFRFIKFAEDAGHICRIYLYSTLKNAPSRDEILHMLDKADAYAEITSSIEYYNPDIGVDPTVDAIFATGWETAYPVFNDDCAARRFYFVQDFEPSFYPIGTQSVLAENTYRFGFHGITAGGWLPEKLGPNYGMNCDHFDFAAEVSNYAVTNTEERNEIFFYARPATERRAFELGLMVLQEFARLRPDVTINLAGWDLSNFKIPFAHVSHGMMNLRDLNELYNRCRAGLVLSLTNMSLLPLELLAAGVVPVVNDAPNNRMVTDHDYIQYAAPTPHAMAECLIAAFEEPQNPAELARSVSNHTWADSGKQFLQAFTQVMHDG